MPDDPRPDPYRHADPGVDGLVHADELSHRLTLARFRGRHHAARPGAVRIIPVDEFDPNTILGPIPDPGPEPDVGVRRVIGLAITGDPVPGPVDREPHPDTNPDRRP